WCSMRISKEIEAFTSGKDPTFQPARKAMQSPGVSTAGYELLRRRAHALPVVAGKHACHSDVVSNDEAAKAIQEAALERADGCHQEDGNGEKRKQRIGKASGRGGRGGATSGVRCRGARRHGGLERCRYQVAVI